jgi:DNA-binding FrmR family transcriptional regulator
MIEDMKKRALHRTKILEGQIRGLQKMIDADEYCMDILTQSLAVQKSIGSLNQLIIENHVRTHVSDMMTSGNETMREKAVEELLGLYDFTKIRSK